jgi:lanosterol synthase
MIRSNGAAVSSANGYSKAPEERSIEVEAIETHSAKRPKLSERTDYTRWRMLDEKGRHTWHYLEDDEDAKEWPQSIADKYFLNLPTVSCIHQDAVKMLN